MRLSGWGLCWMLAACSPADTGFVRAYEIEALDQAVGGPKAVAREGDFVLENQHVRLAFLGERNSLGPGLFGGSLVDADIQRRDPAFSGGQGLDQFAELIPTGNMNVAHPGLEDPLTGQRLGGVSIVEEGQDGTAVLRVDGPAIPFLSLLDPLWALVSAPDLWLTTDYKLYDDRPWLELNTVVRYDYLGTGEPANPTPVAYSDNGMPLLDWAMETGLAVGEFYLSGGSVDVFAPGIGFDEDGAVFEKMREGGNTFTAPFQFDFIAGVADGVSYGIASKEGDLYVPLFTASQTVAVGGGLGGDGSPGRFPTGSAFSYERYFFVGHGDVGSIVDQYVEARGLPYGEVRGTVREEHSGTPLSGVDVFVYRPGDAMPWSHWRTDVHPDDELPDGSFGGRLPVGDWELLVHDRGRPEARRLRVKVAKDEAIQVQLLAGRGGAVTFEVHDERGRLVPSKVSFFRLDGPARPDPVLGDEFIGGSPDFVAFAPYGAGSVELAPGKYQAVASRGVEYEVDVSEPFVLDSRQGARVQLQVVRSVDTLGWISADLHVHGVASHDSSVSREDRVITMVAEGVEFFSSTDHDYIVDYAPSVERLGLEDWVQTAVGSETTTVEIGHFLGFPLQADFLGEAGATREAMDWTGKGPQALIDALRETGEAGGHDPMVFVAHPRDGILGYFDQYGFDPYSGTPGVGGNPGTATVITPTLSVTNPVIRDNPLTWDFDALELMNGKRLELLRTPTQLELDAFAAGEGVDVYDFMSRTAQEQEELAAGIYRLGYGYEGQIDDWFTLLNLGYRFTALGNSDTHGRNSIEAGCPRNYVLSDTDAPSLLDDQAVADAIKEHRVIATNGPFIEFTANGEPVGSEISGGGPVELQIRVQAAGWVPVDRVELYENGTMIREWSVPPGKDAVRFDERFEVTPARDSWYVVVAMGEGDLGPVMSPVELPYVDLQVIVEEALANIEVVASLLSPSVPVPREFPVMPYGLTNPIWVDVNGGGFDAPGLPGWLLPPVAPATTE